MGELIKSYRSNNNMFLNSLDYNDASELCSTKILDNLPLISPPNLKSSYVENYDEFNFDSKIYDRLTKMIDEQILDQKSIPELDHINMSELNNHKVNYYEKNDNININNHYVAVLNKKRKNYINENKELFDMVKNTDNYSKPKYFKYDKNTYSKNLSKEIDINKNFQKNQSSINYNRTNDKIDINSQSIIGNWFEVTDFNTKINIDECENMIYIKILGGYDKNPDERVELSFLGIYNRLDGKIIMQKIQNIFLDEKNSDLLKSKKDNKYVIKFYKKYNFENLKGYFDLKDLNLINFNNGIKWLRQY